MPPRASQSEELPDGLVYREGLVSAEEERRLLATLGDMAFGAVTMRGQTARRTVRHFGLDYAYETGELVPTDPLPDAMLWLRDRCAALMGREPAGSVAALKLTPRSAYLLAGKARWSWQHSIPATKELRYSVTFRTLHAHMPHWSGPLALAPVLRAYAGGRLARGYTDAGGMTVYGDIHRRDGPSG